MVCRIGRRDPEATETLTAIFAVAVARAFRVLVFLDSALFEVAVLERVATLLRGDLGDFIEGEFEVNGGFKGLMFPPTDSETLVQSDHGVNGMVQDCLRKS